MQIQGAGERPCSDWGANRQGPWEEYVIPIEILELECGLYCSLFHAVEPLRRTKMVDPRWQKNCYALWR